MAWIILALVIGLCGGVVIGIFIARSTIKKQLVENPPITEDMMRAMMMQMGQTPSSKKLHQVMESMKDAQRKANKRKK
ncbi:YneF family protein [Xylocopilactobacillus apis]|uniref:UPF0154 protein n=1 Tax=Xylocopilactobacillus apis TaxID=2932183 RepID=A0AAU9D8W7_9LACO|nr:YneF family protein [Xylocopilactobacillus apis]BDR56115.1 UPF0154 protein [Xylocopilactobacillus apis]